MTSTSALVLFLNEYSQEICRLLITERGDPETLGADLASLCDKVLVDHLTNETMDTHAVGIGCLAAYAISGLKLDAGIGVVRIMRPDGLIPEGYDFIYVVADAGAAVQISVYDPTFEKPFGLSELLENESVVMIGSPKEITGAYGPKVEELN